MFKTKSIFTYLLNLLLISGLSIPITIDRLFLEFHKTSIGALIRPRFETRPPENIQYE